MPRQLRTKKETGGKHNINWPAGTIVLLIILLLAFLLNYFSTYLADSLSIPGPKTASRQFYGKYNWNLGSVNGIISKCSNCVYITNGQIPNIEGSFSNAAFDNTGNMTFNGPARMEIPPRARFPTIQSEDTALRNGKGPGAALTGCKAEAKALGRFTPESISPSNVINSIINIKIVNFK